MECKDIRFEAECKNQKIKSQLTKNDSSMFDGKTTDYHNPFGNDEFGKSVSLPYSEPKSFDFCSQRLPCGICKLMYIQCPKIPMKTEITC